MMSKSLRLETLQKKTFKGKKFTLIDYCQESLLASE